MSEHSPAALICIVSLSSTSFQKRLVAKINLELGQLKMKGK